MYTSFEFKYHLKCSVSSHELVTGAQKFRLAHYNGQVCVPAPKIEKQLLEDFVHGTCGVAS